MYAPWTLQTLRHWRRLARLSNLGMASAARLEALADVGGILLAH